MQGLHPCGDHQAAASEQSCGMVEVALSRMGSTVLLAAVASGVLSHKGTDRTNTRHTFEWLIL